MKFRDLVEAREPKDVWKNGGQQVMTYKNKSILYTVKNKIVKFEMPDKIVTEIGLEFNDPEKTIIKFLDKNLKES